MTNLKSLKARLNEGQDLQKAIFRHAKSYKNFENRVNKRIKKILVFEFVYFLTFTIAPQYEHLKPSYLYRKVKEALAQASIWIVNPDHGSENSRLHFHALAAFPFELSYKDYITLYRYGSINIKRVHVRNESALSKYVVKMQNHAQKTTALKISFSRLNYKEISKHGKDLFPLQPKSGSDDRGTHE